MSNLWKPSLCFCKDFPILTPGKYKEQIIQIVNYEIIWFFKTIF